MSGPTKADPERIAAIKDELKHRPAISVQAFCELIGSGRSAGYRIVNEGEVESIRLGGKILILSAPLRRKLGLDQAAA